jgi:hypothetical protein
MCQPRHRHACEPSFLKLHGILGSGEQYLPGPTSEDKAILVAAAADPAFTVAAAAAAVDTRVRATPPRLLAGRRVPGRVPTANVDADRVAISPREIASATASGFGVSSEGWCLSVDNLPAGDAVHVLVLRREAY